MSFAKEIAARAAREPEFRARLLKDAKGTLEKELGVKVPDGVQFHIHENSDAVVHLVLPAGKPQRQLSDVELDQVAGGVKKQVVTLPTSTPSNTGWWECR
jgi:hypothetical protein